MGYLKLFLEKVRHTLEGGEHYAHAPLENHVGVCAPSIFAKINIKDVNIFKLANVRIERQNRSVKWDII